MIPRCGQGSSLCCLCWFVCDCFALGRQCSVILILPRNPLLGYPTTETDISYVGRCTVRTTFVYCTGQHAKIHTNVIKFLHCITIITGKALPSICTSIRTTAIYMSTCKLIYAFTVTIAIARTVFSILSQRTF